MTQRPGRRHRETRQVSAAEPPGTTVDSDTGTLHSGLPALGNSVDAGGVRVDERAVLQAKARVVFAGRDEMNLVECPLSAVADRFLDGRKTVVFRDRVWDPDR